MTTYEETLFGYFNNTLNMMKVQPLNLGGYLGSGGGVGGPPGGFMGYLPQPRVAYDESEAASTETSEPPSLLDNLNHIRFRLSRIEASGNYGTTIENDFITIASGVTIINFADAFDVEKTGAFEVTVRTLSSGVRSDAIYSGVYNENLSAQISGTHFTVAKEISDASLRVFVNGIKQEQTDYTIDSNKLGFTTAFTVISGDVLSVDYDVLITGVFHTHSEYMTRNEIESEYLDADSTYGLLDTKSDVGHTHVMADITDLGIDAVSIQGTPVYTGIPTNGQVLVLAETGEYTPTTLTIQQQIVFTIADAIDNSLIGVLPTRLYAQEVGSNAEIVEIFGAVDTVPDSSVRFYVLKNGTRIVDPYIVITAGNNTNNRTLFTDSTIVKDDYFQLEILSGDATASDLTVHIRFNRSIP